MYCCIVKNFYSNDVTKHCKQLIIHILHLVNLLMQKLQITTAKNLKNRNALKISIKTVSNKHSLNTKFLYFVYICFSDCSNSFQSCCQLRNDFKYYEPGLVISVSALKASIHGNKLNIIKVTEQQLRHLCKMARESKRFEA